MADTELDPIIVTARFGGGFFRNFGFDAANGERSNPSKKL